MVAEDVAPYSAMDDATTLHGEFSAPPRTAFATAIRGLSGYALLAALTRAAGRLALGYRRPATLVLGEPGLQVEHRTEMMGRVLTERSTLVPLGNLARVTREVRYARASLYAGLVALALGTYVGVGLLIDGLRVSSGSASLVGMGVAVVVLGLVLDFFLLSAFDSSRSKCRIVVVPRTGKAVVVAGIDRLAADAFLARVAQISGYRIDVDAPASSPSSVPVASDSSTGLDPSPAPRADGTPPPV